MNPYAVPPLITAFIILSIGLFVLHKNHRSKTNRTFAFFCFSLTWWLLSYSGVYLSKDEAHALFWGRIGFIGIIFIPILAYHFVISFLNLERKKVLKWLYLASLPSLLLSHSQYIYKGVKLHFWGYYPEAGSLYILFMGLFVSIFLGISRILYITMKEKQKNNEFIQYGQIKFVFLSFAFGNLGIIDYVIKLGLDFYPFGYAIACIFIMLNTYAIVRFRLMDISVVINRGLTYGFLLGLIFVPAYLFAIISERATIYSAPPFLAMTLIFACGLWIVLKNPRAAPNITFSLVCLGVCIWLFGVFMAYSTMNTAAALFWSKFTYLGVVYIPAFFYHFCESFLRAQVKKKPVLINYLASTAFLMLIPSSYLIDGVYHYFWGFYPRAGILHPLFLVYFTLAGGLSLWKLYSAYKAKAGTAPLESTRIRYLLWAFVIGYIASIDFIQNYGFEFYPTGYLYTGFLVIIVTYAISKYQLMDIALVLTKTKLLSYAKTLGLIPFYFIVLLLIRMFTGEVQYLLSGFLVAMFSIFAGILANLQRQMERTVEKTLFRKRYDAYQTLTEFTKAIVSILDLGELTEKITSTLSKGMGVDRVSTFLLDEKSGYSTGSCLGLEDKIKRIQLKADNPLPKALTKRGEIIIKEELDRDLFVDENKPLIDNMAVIEAEVSIPFISKGRLVGFCNLGNKKSRDMYTNEDLQLLGNLASQAAIAIENARLHYLEKKSLILMKQIDKVDTFARFAGGMAHEINNPLVTISTFFQLLPQKRDDNEFMDSFASLAFTETERIRRLTRELLDYGKPKEIQFRMEDLNILVTRVVLLIKLEAEKKKIILQSVLTSDLPRIHMDPDQIRQVILNILLNAIDATDEGGSITIETRYIGADQKDEFVQVMIKDTGEGIAKEEIDKIFDPFFTTKHTSIGREGTGLGLSISHQIIKEHKGFINVESTLGKGTTFLIYIPVNSISSEREERSLPIASAILDTQ